MFKIETPKLQEMVNKLSKCNGNRLLEITNYYEIELADKVLTIRATDGNNFISVMTAGVAGKDIKTIVKADHFAKLVVKTSMPTMTFTLKENYLEVVGNGKYKLDIIEGETYPTFELPEIEPTPIKLTPFKSALAVNKYSVSPNIADGVLTGYYYNGRMLTTSDGIRVCVTPIELGGSVMLVSPEFVGLINALTDEDGELYVTEEGTMAIKTSNAIIFGSEMEGKETYPDIEPLTTTEFPATCTLSKLSILSILDRLNLFINPFERNEIKLIFEEKHLQIETLSGSYETIAYVGIEKHVPYTCSVNGALFKDLVSAVKTETFKLHFGEEILIRIDTADTIQLLATGEEEQDA